LKARSGNHPAPHRRRLGIDSQIVDRDADHEVYVIPSPERRLDPKGWVHRPVPTTKPRDGGE
jgi:hypothetical protein